MKLFNALDYRVGNYVKLIGKPEYKITKKDIYKNIKMSDDFEPFKLTENWLIYLGFISNPYKDRYEKGDFYVECDKTKGKLNLFVNGYGKTLEYVHELQNLYYLINNEELS